VLLEEDPHRVLEGMLIEVLWSARSTATFTFAASTCALCLHDRYR
jgi:NADH:ubiquinone oxidoreductase subunit F (NADH-binding)